MKLYVKRLWLHLTGDKYICETGITCVIKNDKIYLKGKVIDTVLSKSTDCFGLKPQLIFGMHGTRYAHSGVNRFILLHDGKGNKIRYDFVLNKALYLPYTTEKGISVQAEGIAIHNFKQLYRDSKLYGLVYNGYKFVPRRSLRHA